MWLQQLLSVLFLTKFGTFCSDFHPLAFRLFTATKIQLWVFVNSEYASAMTNKKAKRQTYDHRLRDFVRETGNMNYAVELGVPKSTAKTWLNTSARKVITDEFFDLGDVQIRARILKLEGRVKCLTAIMVLLITLIRVSRIRVDGKRIADGKNKERLLRAIERACKTLALRTVLRIIGISSTKVPQLGTLEKPRLSVR